MGIPVMIGGLSGMGKSFSLHTLNPALYGLIEVYGKALPFRTRKKYAVCDNAERITNMLRKSYSKILVIDDSQYIMADQFMRRASDKGYEKFTDIGVSFWNLINSIKDLPPDVIVYFMHHIEPDGMNGWKLKTVGKMLDNVICLEGLFTIILRALKIDGQYMFSTQSDGTDPVKTPYGMFKSSTIPNDLKLVDESIRKYYQMEVIK